MKKRILVIDDEENLAELLRFRLEANGYAVDVAFDGKTGIDRIMSTKPDLVVLDIMMPGMNGYEVLKLAKANEATKDIPILMLTARAQFQDENMSMDLGADFFLPKPFEPGELLKAIENLLK